MSSSRPAHRPLNDVGPVRLKALTDPAWLPQALEHFDEVLSDHAHCEKKAAAHALSLLQAYPELPGLPAQMARLAREESAHLAQVLQRMETRGLTLKKDLGDPYVQGLQTFIRTPSKERCVDRLLVAAIVEARSCERLGLLARGIAEKVAARDPRFDESLTRLYTELAQSEDGHQALFFRLASQLVGEVAANERLDALLEKEAELLRALRIRRAIH